MSPHRIPVYIYISGGTFSPAPAPDPAPAPAPAWEPDAAPVRHTRMVFEDGSRRPPRPMMYGNDVYFAPRGHTTLNPATGLYEAPEGQRLNPLAAFLNWLFGSSATT